MKRILFFILLLLLTLFFQIALTGWTEKIKVDLFLLLTIFWSQSRGWKEGIITGFLSGFLKDIFFSPVLGISTFSLILIGWLVGEIQSKIYQQNFLLLILLVASGSLFHAFVISSWLTFLYRFSFILNFTTSIYPAFFYNLLFASGAFVIKETFTKKFLTTQS